MWPLNARHQGRNLIKQKTDIELHDVSFNDRSNEWVSKPAYFSGTPTSFGQFSNVDDVKVSGDFAFIVAVYSEDAGHGPLLEWQTGSQLATHIWLNQAKLSIEIRYINNQVQKMKSSTLMSQNQWYTLALSFDSENDKVSMWVNGELEEQQVTDVESEYMVPTDAYVNKRYTLSPLVV